jgi:hypothetical protein
LVKRNIKIILLSGLIIVSLAIFISFHRNDAIIDRVGMITVSRIYHDIIDGDISKDSNRAGLMQKAYTTMLEYPLTGEGLSNALNSKNSQGNVFDNPFAPFAVNGIIFGLMPLAPLLYLLFKLMLLKRFDIVIIFLLNQMQRSLSASVVYMFLIGIIILQTANKKYSRYSGLSIK